MMIGKLQFISQENQQYTHLQSIEVALQAGIKWIQLRLKDLPMQEVERQAHQARVLCDQYNAKLIINDYPAIARKVKADGVHTGKKDMPVHQVRRLLGSKMILGATANTFFDIESHVKDGADYIGVGPFRFTNTKKELSPLLGLKGYQEILKRCREKNIDIPLIAIGGINADDISGLMNTGLHGIAASSMILNHPPQIIHTISEIVNKEIC